MKIPSKVRIGSITYKVSIKDDWDGRGDADGECFYHGKYGNTIFIDKSLTKEARELTLIHEALHAMNATINHEFLDSLSAQIYSFLKENHIIK